MAHRRLHKVAATLLRPGEVPVAREEEQQVGASPMLLPRLEDRLNHGVKLVLGRAARPEELQILVEGFTADLARFQAQPELADKLLQVGETPRPANRPTPEAAAWTLTANTLLNLDEATTRE